MANNITITGRLTADPELKTTISGASICSFTLAVKRPHVKDTTDFIPCVAWRQGAEYLSRYGAKGNMVAATGALTTRKWQDKDGNNRVNYAITCDSVELLESRSSGEANNNTAHSASKPQSAPENASAYNPYDGSQNFEELSEEDELPF
jgi:single-strand DNA-binding protein